MSQCLHLGIREVCVSINHTDIIKLYPDSETQNFVAWMRWQQKPSPTYVVETAGVNDSGTVLVKPHGNPRTGLVRTSNRTTRMIRSWGHCDKKGHGVLDSFALTFVNLPLQKVRSRSGRRLRTPTAKSVKLNPTPTPTLNRTPTCDLLAHHDQANTGWIFHFYVYIIENFSKCDRTAA